MPMDSLKGVLCLAVVLSALACGASAPLLMPQDAYAEITAAFGENPLLYWVAAACGAVLSAVTMHVVAHAVARQTIPLFLLLVKLFVFALPACAIGVIVSLLVGSLGIFEIRHQIGRASCRERV